MPRNRLKEAIGYVRKENGMALKQPSEDTVTYITSSGNARVIYYPLRGEVKIGRKRVGLRTARPFPYGDWDDEDSILLSPQDAIEIGIYLLGLQPHIRDVLARKDNAQGAQPVECSTPDQDL